MAKKAKEKVIEITAEKLEKLAGKLKPFQITQASIVEPRTSKNKST